MARFSKVNKWDEARLKSDSEYEKTVNDVELWKSKNGYRLFKRVGTQLLFAGAFSPLAYAEELARKED